MQWRKRRETFCGGSKTNSGIRRHFPDPGLSICSGPQLFALSHELGLWVCQLWAALPVPLGIGMPGPGMWVLAEQLKWCRRAARRGRGVVAVPGVMSCLSCSCPWCLWSLVLVLASDYVSCRASVLAFGLKGVKV